MLSFTLLGLIYISIYYFFKWFKKIENKFFTRVNYLNQLIKMPLERKEMMGEGGLRFVFFIMYGSISIAVLYAIVVLKNYDPLYLGITCLNILMTLIYGIIKYWSLNYDENSIDQLHSQKSGDVITISEV